MPARSCCFQYSFSPSPAAPSRHYQVVGHLQVHPEFRRRFEKRSQPDRRVPCDASFILQNRRDPVGRHPDRLRERVCRQAQRFQKLLVENFTRRHRSHSILSHFVTDHDSPRFNVVRITIFFVGASKAQWYSIVSLSFWQQQMERLFVSCLQAAI